MRRKAGRRISNRLRRSLCLALAGVLNVAGSAFAQASLPQDVTQREVPSGFAVASIRPSQPGGQLAFDVTDEGFRATSTPLFWIVLQAYCPLSTAYWRNDRVAGGPAWVRTQAFDIDARLEETERRGFAKLTDEQREMQIRVKLRALLRERFGLQAHEETGPAMVWKLTGSKSLRLTPTSAKAALVEGVSIGDGGTLVHMPMNDGRHGLRFANTSMKKFAEVLSGLETEDNPPIVDGTGLAGHFDFVLYKREQDSAAPDGAAPSSATGWDVRALGFRLVRGQADLPRVVLDQVHEPSEN